MCKAILHEEVSVPVHVSMEHVFRVWFAEPAATEGGCSQANTTNLLKNAYRITMAALHFSDAGFNVVSLKELRALLDLYVCRSLKSANQPAAFSLFQHTHSHKSFSVCMFHKRETLVNHSVLQQCEQESVSILVVLRSRFYPFTARCVPPGCRIVMRRCDGDKRLF